VRPDDRLGALAARAVEVLEQVPDRFHHVVVADVPGVHRPREHVAVILLGVDDQPGVLLGEKELVLRRDTVALFDQLVLALLELNELGNRLLLAALLDLEAGDVAVVLRVFPVMAEAAVAVAGAAGGGGVGLLEEIEHGRDRGVQAIQVHPVKSALRLFGQDRAVVQAQPVRELQHLAVPPHPLRETLEAGQCRVGVRVVVGATHVAVHAIRVGPIRFHDDGGEAALRDELLRDLRAGLVKLVGSVRRLADQHEPAVADGVEQGIEVIGPVVEDAAVVGDDFHGVGVRFRHSGLLRRRQQKCRERRARLGER
jgi:hypothetical protein